MGFVVNYSLLISQRPGLKSWSLRNVLGFKQMLQRVIYSMLCKAENITLPIEPV